MFPRPRALFGTGVDLKVRQQIVGERDELLPRAVGRVGVGRDGVKREAALSCPIVFSWLPRPPMKCQRFLTVSPS